MCIIILTVGRRVNFFSWRAVAASADSFTSCQHPQHGQSTVSFHVVQIFLLGRRHPLAFCWGWFVNDKKKTCYSFSPGHSPIPVISGSRSPRRHPPYGLFQKVSTLLYGLQWVNSGVDCLSLNLSGNHFLFSAKIVRLSGGKIFTPCNPEYYAHVLPTQLGILHGKWSSTFTLIYALETLKVQKLRNARE